jgi:tetratricopeptide (TPR) repeat protein
MSEQNKTVFISYRRSTTFIHSAYISHILDSRGYDVFRDIDSIGAGKFEDIILSNIAARAHFVVLLTHGTLDRCVESGDWLRREIEEAIKLRRNIIPVLIDGFRFEDGDMFLTGELQNLKKFNGLNLYTEYFMAGLDKLCDKYLVLPSYGKIEPIPAEIENKVKEILAVERQEPTPTEAEITAERLFVEALRMQKNKSYDRAITLYSQAIELNPTYAKIYYNRGLAYYKHGDLDKAIQDYTKTLELDSQYAKPYVNRGVAFSKKGEHTEAITDYGTAIQLQPDYPIAYLNRGNSFLALGKIDYALEDYRDFVKYSEKQYPEQIKTINETISLLENYEESKHPHSALNIIPGELEDSDTQILFMTDLKPKAIEPIDEISNYEVEYLPDTETELLPSLPDELAEEMGEEWHKIQSSDEGYLPDNQPED